MLAPLIGLIGVLLGGFVTLMALPALAARRHSRERACHERHVDHAVAVGTGR